MPSFLALHCKPRLDKIGLISMEWYNFEDKRPFVGETILLCWSLRNGAKESVIYKCTFEKLYSLSDVGYYNKRIRFSDMVLVSGRFFCKYSESSTFTLVPNRFRWARLD